VQQRISLPCYEPNHRAKVIKEISKLFMLGEVLGKSFRDEWENGFRIVDVMYLYDWMRSNIKRSSPYIEHFLEEPLAVAGSRLSIAGASTGNVCMVVDVGAGTTDFTMFEIFADAKKDSAVATQVKGSEYGVPVAGDRLDTILLAYILKDAGVSRSDENYKELLVSLRLDIRDYKERLFSVNLLTYSLPSGITGQVKLNEFLQDNSVKSFSQDLHNAFVHVLSSIHPSWIKTKIRKKNMHSKLPIILTGGGAGLPMVRNLAKGVIDVHNYSIQLFLSPAVPAWLEDEYEGEIVDLYPQMAVSLGSAKQFVIQKTGIKEEYV
jgi:molecular chaperone HscA